MERSTIGSNRTGFQSYKQEKEIEQAKVFKAHAEQALKLLANQQEDGDGVSQNIVKDLGKESRKRLDERLA